MTNCCRPGFGIIILANESAHERLLQINCSQNNRLEHHQNKGETVIPTYTLESPNRKLLLARAIVTCSREIKFDKNSRAGARVTPLRLSSCNSTTELTSVRKSFYCLYVLLTSYSAIA